MSEWDEAQRAERAALLSEIRWTLAGRRCSCLRAVESILLTHHPSYELAPAPSGTTETPQKAR